MYQRAVQLNLPKAQSIDIEFHNVTYDVRVGWFGGKKHILNGVSGCFKSGELTAIMGPSGAGKSSLLNILTGFQTKNLGGEVNYSGMNGKRAWSDCNKNSSYIQQDDQLHAQFTSGEMMMMATDLKLGYSLNKKAKKMLIENIMDSLDLTKTMHTRCDRLSGGQKKRLSIALELVDNPPVMFLDEPTTGLDSSSSSQCVAMLKSLALAGRTIVCTIHQPSAVIYEIFDHIYLLAEGRCVYQGAATNTIDYFTSFGFNCPKYHNPADYMIEVVNKEYGNFNDQLAVTSAENNWRSAPTKNIQLLSDIKRRYSDEGKTTVLINPPSEFTKFWVLLGRCVTQLYRDWTVTYLKLILHFLVGVLLGMMYSEAGDDGAKTISNVGYLLISTIYLCYTSMMPACVRFPSELPILKKEKFNNWYRLRTYYAAVMIANFPVHLLSAALYCSVSYFLSNQPLEFNRFLMFSMIATLTILIGDSIGLVIGTLVNPVNGTFVGSVFMAMMLMFSGFVALFKHMPIFMYYISYLSYSRYSFEGMVQSIYGYNRPKLSCTNGELNYCHYRFPSTILSELSMNDANYSMDIIILLSNVVALRFLAYCTLKRKLSSD